MLYYQEARVVGVGGLIFEGIQYYLLGQGGIGAGNKSPNRTATRGGVMVGINTNNHHLLQLYKAEGSGGEEKRERARERERWIETGGR